MNNKRPTNLQLLGRAALICQSTIFYGSHFYAYRFYKNQFLRDMNQNSFPNIPYYEWWMSVILGCSILFIPLLLLIWLFLRTAYKTYSSFNSFIATILICFIFSTTCYSFLVALILGPWELPPMLITFTICFFGINLFMHHYGNYIPVNQIITTREDVLDDNL